MTNRAVQITVVSLKLAPVYNQSARQAGWNDLIDQQKGQHKMNMGKKYKEKYILYVQFL